MTNQEKYYGPLLKSFCSEIKEYKSKIEIQGLFLANIMSKYEKSPKRYFYIGRDTDYWTNFDNMIDLCISDKGEDYIRENNKWLTPENIIKNSSTGGLFWTIVIRLHIYLHTNELINGNPINDNQKDLLNSIGWGNLNCIEVDETLKKRGVWDTMNQSYYWDIKTKSEVFDRLKMILDIYNPDTIFIFNWCDKENYKTKQVLEGLEVDEKTYEKNIIRTYKIKNHNTNLIWCPHPNRLRYLGTNIDEMIQIIKKAYDSLQ
jgi:hypothetical protein